MASSSTTTTLALIKPDAVSANQVTAIESLIAASNFGVLARMETRLSYVQAAHLMEDAQGSPDFASIVKFMSSGPIVALALTCENGVASWLDLLGPEDCSKPNSLRAKFGTDAIRNAAHGSASPAAAYRELKLFFPKTFPRELTVALVAPSSAAAELMEGLGGDSLGALGGETSSNLGAAPNALQTMCATHEFLSVARVDCTLTAAQAESYRKTHPSTSLAQLTSGPVTALLLEKPFATEDLLALLPDPDPTSQGGPNDHQSVTDLSKELILSSTCILASPSPSAGLSEAKLLFGSSLVASPSISFALITPDAITRADEILAYAEASGFTLLASKLTMLNEAQVRHSSSSTWPHA